MTISLPDLPYAKDALQPHLSAETLTYHYEKHHSTYVVNLNKLVKDTPHEGRTLEEIVRRSEGGIFNNAAQVWNHTFYWHCMKPGGGGGIPGALQEAVIRDFGSVEQFTQEFTQAALTQFGSGWAWLVYDIALGKLRITKTANADTPLRDENLIPLLTVDVWEHAYYVDYRNRRPDYVATFLEKLVNWDFALKNYEAATKKKAA